MIKTKCIHRGMDGMERSSGESHKMLNKLFTYSHTRAYLEDALLAYILRKSILDSMDGLSCFLVSALEVN